jgi:CBS domain-containing protein
MIAADVMTREVASVSRDSTLGTAVSIMLDHKVSGLPVVDGQGRLVGILTEGDLLRRVELGTERHRSSVGSFLAGPAGLAEDYVLANTRRVGDLMTANPFSVHEADDLSEVVRVMEGKHVKRLPVVDAESHVVGVVSRADLLRPLAAALNRRPDPSADDVALRDRVATALRAQPWSRAQPLFDVRVSDGVVTLEGTVRDLGVGDAARVAAENVPGVRSVVNDIVWLSSATMLAGGYPIA